MSIESFKQKWLADFYYRDVRRGVKPQLVDRLFRRLKLLDYATCIEDLQSPPGNRLHKLFGGRYQQWSISVSGSWRLCFYFENGQAMNVEFIQYH